MDVSKELLTEKEIEVKSNSSSFFLLYFISIAILFAITNPTTSEHQQFVFSEMIKLANKDFKKERKKNIENFSELFTSNLLYRIGPEFYEKTITRDNYILFSITKYNWYQFENHSESIGIGILGHIFFFKNGKENEFGKLIGDNDFESSVATTDTASAASPSVDYSSERVDISTQNNTEDNNIQSNPKISLPGIYITDGNEDGRAYFHNEPDPITVRKGYLVYGEKVEVQKVENGFGYVEFTNAKGQIIRGWLDLSELNKEQSN